MTGKIIISQLLLYPNCRAIRSAVEGFPRPLLNLSAASFGKVMDEAFGKRLVPTFDPYANTLNFYLASYVIPYVGLTGYVGISPLLQNPSFKRVNPKPKPKLISLYICELSVSHMCMHILHFHGSLWQGFWE